MASIISVDNIRATGTSTNAITIDSSNNLGDITMNAEGGTNTLSVRQGVAKVWGNFTNSTFAVNDSFNTSSITDSGTGSAEPNYTNNMANDDYSATSSAEKSASYHAIFHAAGTNPTTAKNGVNTASALNTAVDAEFVSYQICGDLA